MCFYVFLLIQIIPFNVVFTKCILFILNKFLTEIKDCFNFQSLYKMTELEI